MVVMINKGKYFLTGYGKNGETHCVKISKKVAMLLIDDGMPKTS